MSPVLALLDWWEALEGRLGPPGVTALDPDPLVDE